MSMKLWFKFEINLITICCNKYTLKNVLNLLEKDVSIVNRYIAPSASLYDWQVGLYND